MLRNRIIVLIVSMFVAGGVVGPVDADQSLPRPLIIEGYTGQLSYAPGDKVAFHVSTTGAKYAMKIYRLGAERTLVWEKTDLPSGSYPIPDNASSHGCGWPASFSWTIPVDLKTGYYDVLFEVSDGGE